jgi:membrane-associated phospholipid phosphatase
MDIHSEANSVDPLAKAFPAALRWRRLEFSADTRTMVRLTILTALLTACLVAVKRLTFPLADAFEPLVTCTILIALAALYQVLRPAPNFVLVLKSLTVLVAFSTIYTILMYALATGGRPLADPMLAGADTALGLSPPSVVHWVNERPAVALVMWLAYISLIPQTILAIVCLGLSNNRYHLDKFLARFMLASLITAVCFYFWPAKGTYAPPFNLPAPSYCLPWGEHLDALRSGARTLVTWRDAEGLITFPSFHTIWAVLLIAAFYGSRRLFWPLAALNVVVVISTVTTGMHYFADVIAGVLISAVVIWATQDRQTEDEGTSNDARGLPACP